MSETDWGTVSRRLQRPFDPKRVKWRVGATNGEKTQGLPLAYIDARLVQQRLDNVFGPDWQCRYAHAGKRVVCDIGIKWRGEWIWRSDGAGDTDHEADKGALSDAFKRAAVRWGIGKYLYGISTPWGAIKKRGNSYVLDHTPQLPHWATPEGYDEIMDRRIGDEEGDGE